MSDVRPNRRFNGVRVARSFGILVLGFTTLLVLALFGLEAPSLALLEILWHLVSGFFSFLLRNLPKISSDAGTWAPGLAAFLVALVIIHRLGASWARRRQRAWRASTTLALGMILPALFATSFLIPGVLLQVEPLSRASWFSRERSEALHSRRALENIRMALIGADDGSGRYPDSLQELLDRGDIQRADLIPDEQATGQPPEPVIYLGKGLNPSSDPSLPLAISPRYSERGVLRRMLLTAGMQIMEIRDDELDTWIGKITGDGVKR